MANIYASLIVKGYKSFNEVPERIKSQVRNILTELGRTDLITE